MGTKKRGNTGIVTPSRVLNLLHEKFRIEDRNELPEEEKYSYETAVIKINEGIHEVINHNSEELAEYLPFMLSKALDSDIINKSTIQIDGVYFVIPNDEYEFINHGTFRRIYRNFKLKDGKETNEKGYSGRKKNLYPIGAYFRKKISYKEFDQLINGKVTHHFKYGTMLTGGWDVYVFDSSKGNIKKVPLWLNNESATNTEYKVDFITPWSAYYTGDARITENKSLIIELKEKNKKDNRIYLCAGLPDLSDHRANVPIIINAGGLACDSSKPVLGSLILIKNDLEVNLDNHLKKGVNDADYDADVKVTLENKLYNLDYIQNQIIIYLHRHRDKSIKPFKSNYIDHIEERNDNGLERVSRDNFRELKEIFDRRKEGYKWYSFSRVLKRKDRIAILEWGFECSNTDQSIKAKRHRVNNARRRRFDGEVILQSDYIYMQLQDKRKINSKNFIAGFPEENGETIKLYGISGTTTLHTNTTELKQIAIREVLVFMPEMLKLDSDKLEAGYIDYDDFMKIDSAYLNLNDKLSLADRNDSVLSYPSLSNHKTVYGRRIGASAFKGEYFVFTSGTRLDRGKRLFVSKLKIDNLGKATSDLHYNNEVQHFEGYLEGFGSNLLLRMKYLPDIRDKEKMPVFMFDPVVYNYITDTKLLTGVIVDTNTKYMVGSYPFMMVAANYISLDTHGYVNVESSERTDRDQGILNELDQLIDRHYPEIESVYGYFFTQQHPQNRLKKNGDVN